MSPRARYACPVLTLGGLLVGSQLLFVTLPAAPTSCVELQRWAADRYAGAPPSLEAFARHDRPHRLAAFNAVSPSVRAALWREQLRRLAERPDLTPSQRALAAEALELITPALYTRDAASMRAFEAFWPRADAAFTRREHRRAWFELGFGIAEQPTSGVWDQMTRPFRASAQDPTCECSTSWGQECGSSSCAPAPVPAPCDVWLGCGPVNAWWCDGLCPF